MKTEEGLVEDTMELSNARNGIGNKSSAKRIGDFLNRIGAALSLREQMSLWGPHRRPLLENIKGIVAFLGLFMMVSGVMVFVMQSYVWLRSGRWMPLSGFTGLGGFMGLAGLPHSWLRDPHSWYGLHKMLMPLLKRAPFSFLLFAVGFVVCGVFISWMDSWRRLDK